MKLRNYEIEVLKVMLDDRITFDQWNQFVLKNITKHFCRFTIKNGFVSVIKGLYLAYIYKLVASI
jgi:hypothetical protein